MSNFVGTRGQLGPRYLLIKRGGVIDFRHFFAAMRLRTNGMLNFHSTSEGTTMLLGVLAEVSQCIDEVAIQKLNSCFSREDLISNRLGARFGEMLIIEQSQAGRKNIAELLFTYLISLEPISASKISKINMPSAGNNVTEAVGAVLKSLADILYQRPINILKIP